MKQTHRLAYLDWMRGLAAVIMLQGHVLEGWVRPEDRTTEWFWWSQFLGGFPAPLFLFLVGVSMALVLDRMRDKGATSGQLALKVLRRGGWILLLAYAFRFEQFLVWYPASKASDMFRVDTLNCIAASTLLIGLFSVLFKTRRSNILVMTATAAVFVAVTPWVYPVRSLPAFVLSYLNGNGQPWYFSIFPWAAFTIAGIAFGYMLVEARQRRRETDFFNAAAVAGVCAFAAGSAMGFFPVFEYGFFNYSLTSPHYFLLRLGLILLIGFGAYRWSVRPSSRRWSPLIVFGQASLVVYWIHIEIVYGRVFHHFSHSLRLTEAAAQLIWLVPLMAALASGRTLYRAWCSPGRLQTAALIPARVPAVEPAPVE